ncbi:carbohydrate ABC transporter permease [Paenibacillus sp. IITD108]|uniref:carbohydrate ABC transporter permease n=1 Tax=Paenibacillus sp. IITD108 TaxID=3116649 RepID=UPI002F40945A
MQQNQLVKQIRRNLTGWILIAPAVLFLGIFSLFPIFKTIHLSFFQTSLSFPEPIFNGFSNFQDVFADTTFKKVIWNNLRFTLMVVPISICLGLMLALLVNKKFKGIGIARAALFYPNVSPMIGFAFIWVFLLTPNIGFFDNILGFFGIPSVNWLTDTSLSLISIAIVYVWHEAGFIMLFFLSGLQNISKDYYEAARIDGASSFHAFRKITLPLLMPTTLFVLTISLVNSVKIVDTVFIMTGGGPDNSSNLLMYYIYTTAFTFWNSGGAAALTVIMLASMLLIALLQFFVLDRKTHYEN